MLGTIVEWKRVMFWFAMLLLRLARREKSVQTNSISSGQGQSPKYSGVGDGDNRIRLAAMLFLLKTWSPPYRDPKNDPQIHFYSSSE